MSQNPSDYHSADGSMALSLNLIPEQGGLKTLPQPNVVSTLSGYTIIHIHKAPKYVNYIVKSSDGKKLSFINTEDGTLGENYTESYFSGRLVLTLTDRNTINDVTHVGNTIIVNATNGLHYLLWKDNFYTLLGQHLPELPISFGLKGESKYTKHSCYIGDASTVVGAIYRPSVGEEVHISNKTHINALSSVIGNANKFIAEKSVNDGKFLFPFLVRYAFRLFDGTTTMASSPVLMVTDSGVCPHAIVDSYNLTMVEYSIRSMLFDLNYLVQKNNSTKEDFLRWSDIIKSVDIFVSAPIYKYNQSGDVKGFSCYESEKRGYSISCPTVDRIPYRENPGTTDEYFKYFPNAQFLYGDNTRYSTKEYRGELSAYNGSGYEPSTDTRNTMGMEEIILPSFDDDDVIKDVNNKNLFYLVNSIDVQDLQFIDNSLPQNGRKKIPIEKGILGDSLYTRETLADDYNSHDLLSADVMHTYNSRLHLGNVKRKISDAFNASAYIPFTTTCKPFDDESASYIIPIGTKSKYTVYLHITEDGKDIVVKGDDAVLGFHGDYQFLYLYCNNNKAHKATIHSVKYNIDTADPSFTSVYELPLTKHDFLNGSFFFGGFDPGVCYGTIPSVSSDSDRTIDVPNKLYVSEVGNPFSFPVTGINTIGAGEIIGLASASREMSQGQFGQFPLYALCSDGVWALSTNDTGGYSAIQPITRDVCVNNKSILSTDRDVLFATSRGIIRLYGSQSECITDSVMSHKVVNFTDSTTGLKYISSLFGQLGITNASEMVLGSFESFLVNCQMIYDYMHQRIIAFNTGGKYAYVFSLNSGQWGIMQSTIASTVNSYPEAMAMDGNGHLVNFSTYVGSDIKGLFISRPIKLGVPDVIKTINTILQRGQFRDGKLCTALYGSRDLIHWNLVGSSQSHRIRNIRGSGYKYFRVAGVVKMKNDECLSGATIEFMPKHTNVAH